MKNEGALARHFMRHDGIYRSDVSSLLVNPGRVPASRSGPGQAIERAGRNTLCPSSAMSSGRLFLDGVAVGMTIADHPPHRSVLAELPHTAPPLDTSVETHIRVGMQGARCRNPPVKDGADLAPGHPRLLTPAA